MVRNTLLGGLIFALLVVTGISINSTPVHAQAASSIRLENRDWSTLFGLGSGAPAELNYLNSWLTFSKIKYGIPNKGDKPLLTHDTAVLRVHNSGAAPLQITGLSIDNPANEPLEFILVNPPALPHNINTGGFLDLTIQFVESEEIEKLIIHRTLTITSNDATQPTTLVQLHGAYMLNDEGNHEVSSPELAEVFGFNIDLGFPLDSHFYRGDDWRINVGGDEVYSHYWRRADETKPTYLRQLAAFHGCCTAQDSFGISGTGGGTIAHNGSYGQSVLPLFINSSTNPAERVYNTISTSSFAVNISGFDSFRCEGQETTCNAHAVRFWPVKNNLGQVVPNTYFVLQDFVGGGCGAGSSNCDYNDNVYLVTNITPVNSYIDMRPRFQNFGDWYLVNTNFTVRFRSENLNWWPSGDTTITISIPAGVTINWVTTPVGSCATTAAEITCNIGSISRGSPVAVTVNARGNALGVHTFTASISHGVTEFNVANNTASRSIEIVAVAPTDSPTNTPVPPTATFTSVPPTATFTEVPPTDVPPTATFTDVPPTDVPPTATFTEVPPTDVPPTATVTSEQPTDVPPTATATSEQPTDVPPTATATTEQPTDVPPTATATEEVINTVNLLVNGGFEIDINPADKQPDSWTVLNKSQDKLKCNKPTKIFAYEGNCAYNFTGSPVERAKLAQSPDLSAYTFVAGDRLDLSVQYRTNSSQPRLKVKVVVSYADTTLAINGRSVNAMVINTVSNGIYTQFALPTITLLGDASKIKVQFQNKATAGKLMLDDAKLIFTPLDNTIP